MKLVLLLCLVSCAPARPMESASRSAFPRPPQKIRIGGMCSESINLYKRLDPEDVTYGPACMRVNADVQSPLSFASRANAISASAFALDEEECVRLRSRSQTFSRDVVPDVEGW